ncbi:hypothetical protein CFC21_008346 [Triticum aestivum]|uniref:Late embryogenesis abundant protein LEA-2 subgroup domain-containing protein n=2 Tax=Triticum aestivum TaxID=4565 RepID=A0A3B5Z2F9_WHEAT|nr:uncharacterized protein LOC123096636 [Triticum aestivum]KAF6991239.1 hypothetical protein CFC21_008346 [Triticum aestivum]
MATAASSSRVAAVAEQEDKNEPARPLAIPHPHAHPAASDVDEAAQTATGWRSTQYLRRKRRCLLCCGGCCVATAVIVGILILALSLTVFKVKDPRLTMNGVSLAALRAGPGTGLADPVAANATLTADVSIENPNIASFRFSPSATEVYLGGRTVSVAYVPGGRVGAHGSVRMNVTVDILGDRLSGAVNATGLLLGQAYDLTTYTEMGGTVKVLGIYKKDLEIRMNCSVTVEVGGFAGVLVSGAPASVHSNGVTCAAHVS